MIDQVVADNEAGNAGQVTATVAISSAGGAVQLGTSTMAGTEMGQSVDGSVDQSATEVSADGTTVSGSVSKSVAHQQKMAAQLYYNPTTIWRPSKKKKKKRSRHTLPNSIKSNRNWMRTKPNMSATFNKRKSLKRREKRWQIN